MKTKEDKLLAAVRSHQRSEEIKAHGKLISMRSNIVKSKKSYSRKLKHRNHEDSYLFSLNLI